jgi:hypothetical protein
VAGVWADRLRDVAQVLQAHRDLGTAPSAGELEAAVEAIVGAARAIEAAGRQERERQAAQP